MKIAKPVMISGIGKGLKFKSLKSYLDTLDINEHFLLKMAYADSTKCETMIQSSLELDDSNDYEVLDIAFIIKTNKVCGYIYSKIGLKLYKNPNANPLRTFQIIQKDVPDDVNLDALLDVYLKERLVKIDRGIYFDTDKFQERKILFSGKGMKYDGEIFRKKTE